MPRLVQNIGDGYVFPLGVAYISSSMKKDGFNVTTLNLNHREGDVFDILKKIIEENNINVVATGGLSPQYHLVKNVVESAKHIDSKIITIVGGGIITADSKTAMKALEFVDFGVIGEGEEAMCELCHFLEARGDLSQVDGIIYKEGEDFKITNPRKDIVDIDKIPWPDYEGFETDKYLEIPPAGFAGLNQKRMICVLGSRSCPFQCTFCCHTLGKRYRKRSLDDFFAELDYLVTHYKIDYISLADEVFAPDFESAKKFCDRIKPYNIHWYADFRVDTVKPELLPILKDSGLDVMFFGLESADNRILKSMRKGITIEQTESILKMVYDAGIAGYGCFIFGDVEETLETANNTLRWWREHKEYSIHLTLIKPFPGSYIYGYACEKGIIKDPIQYLKDGCPQVNISKMNNEEFAEIMRQIHESSQLTGKPEALELLSVDPVLGRESISGVCMKCKKKNVWTDVKLFANDYISCVHCGQKYDNPNPAQLIENFDKNLVLLLKKYGKVAVWGMTLVIMELFRNSKMLNDPNVFAIDISDSKRKMNLDGKEIYDPEILERENIPVVVIAVPSHASQISCQIKQNHMGVTEIIDICKLADFYPIIPQKLNFLLVMPRLVQRIGDGYSFPLGITFISSSMKNAGFNTRTLNLNHSEGNVYDILKKEIEENKIDVIGVGGLSFQYNTVRIVVESAKRIKNDIITIVGGGIISGDPEPAMQALEYADFGVIGEGEMTMNELCSALEGEKNFADIEGIIYKNRDSYTTNNPRKEMANIDTLPWPDYGGFEIQKYLDSTPPGISGLNRKTLFMLASRSCPYSCTFCFHTNGRRYRQRSLDDFFAELESVVSRYHIEFVCMADELFARNMDRVKEFCERIKKFNIRWWAQFRVDDITPELLAVLKDGGCEVMSFGLESADNRILKSMRKGITIEQIEHTLKMVYDAGISFEGAFIFGDIEETVETANNTLKWWRDHVQYRITLNLITVYPGSYLYMYACEKGIIKSKVRFLKDGCPQINVSKMSDKDLSVLVRQLVEAPIIVTKQLVSPELKSVNFKTGRIGLSGACLVCGHKSDWADVRMFTMNFLPCKKCGQKYNVPLFAEIRKNIDNNLAALLNKYGKVAVWGINYHSSDLFKNSEVLHNPNIFPVDISQTKRRMDLYGKEIFSSEIIERENIKAVIIAVPVYYAQISSLIQTNHKGVVDVIDICALTSREYVVSEILSI